jgi:hypothetical protein
MNTVKAVILIVKRTFYILYQILKTSINDMVMAESSAKTMRKKDL